MSTRAQVRFATREEGVSFSEHPNAIHAQFYRHHDGYPEGLGVDIANSILNRTHPEGRAWEIEPLDSIFVGEPSNLINKYKLNTNANG